MKKITLEQKIAYLLRNPITKPDQMPQQLVTAPIDAEWQKFIDQQWWSKKNSLENLDLSEFPHPEMIKTMIKLREILLSFGGSEVCMPGYDDRIHMMKGQPSQCHRNSSYCWEANQDKAVLCTGYGLSEDGMWRQHSWLVELRPRRNRIVETTVPRVAYFGYGMTTEEAWDFYYDNE